MPDFPIPNKRTSQHAGILRAIRDQLADIKSFDYFSAENVDEHNEPIEIPQEIRTLVEQRLRTAASLTGTSAEIVALRVNELEFERKLSQVKRLAGFLADLSKYSTDDKIENGEFASRRPSLQPLIEQIYSLPEITITPTESNADTSDDLTLVSEYRILRKSLMVKCSSIEVGESKLRRMEDDIREIENLEGAVKDHLKNDSPNAVKEYMRNLSRTLEAELDTTRELLDQVVNSPHTTVETKKALKHILEDLEP